MIDEELYQLAADELNSDRRRPHIWARACALASDDHDEARYLYTNLRVEELIAERDSSGSPVSVRQANVAQVDSLELEPIDFSAEQDSLDADLVVSQSSSLDRNLGDDTGGIYAEDDTGLEMLSTELPDDADLADGQITQSAQFTKERPTSVPGQPSIEFDNGHDLDLDPDDLARINDATDGAVSAIDGNQIDEHDQPADFNSLDQLFDEVDDKLEQSHHDGEIIDADIVESESILRASSHTQDDLPGLDVSGSQHDSDPLAAELERQAQDMHDGSADNDSPDTQLAEVADIPAVASGALAATAANAVVRSDYADNRDFREDIAEGLGEPVDLTAGENGTRYAVYHRDGKTRAVKTGVSWSALFLTLPWLLYRQLFGTAILYIILWLVLISGLVFTGLAWLDAGNEATTMQRMLPIGFAVLSVIGLLYIPFRYGNVWRADKLEKRGYDLAAWVKAKSPAMALKKARRAATLA